MSPQFRLSMTACVIAALLGGCTEVPSTTVPVNPVSLGRSVQSGATGLIGPKGDKGDTGPAGAKGDKGDTGVAGPQGDRGPVGVGQTGPQGASPSTTTSAAFTVATGDTVVKVADPSAFVKGSVVLFSDGTQTMYAMISAKTETSLTVVRLGYPNDAIVGATFASGTNVGVAGLQGTKGDKGDTGAVGQTGQTGQTGATGSSPISLTSADVNWTDPTAQFTVTVQDATAFVPNSVLLLTQVAPGNKAIYVTLLSKAGNVLTVKPVVTVANPAPSITFATGSMIGVVGAQGQKGDTGQTGQTGATGIAPFTSLTVGTAIASGSQLTLVVGDSRGFPQNSTIIVSDAGNFCYATVDVAPPDATHLTVTRIANTGNAANPGNFNAGAVIAIAGPMGATGGTGTVGATGASPLTTTTADFTLTNAVAQFTLNVADTTAFAVGSYLVLTQGGNTGVLYAQINSKTATTIKATPITTPSNATVGTVFTAGSPVAVAGAQGIQGITGASPKTTLVLGQGVTTTFGNTGQTITVGDNSGFVPDSTVIITQGANFFYATVTAIPAGTTQLTVTRLIGTGNAGTGVPFSNGAVVSVAGAAGPAPNSLTVNPYTVGTVGNPQTVDVNNASAFAAGAVVIITNGTQHAYATINSIDLPNNRLTVTPLGYVGDAAPGTGLGICTVAVAGLQGPQGQSGNSNYKYYTAAPNNTQTCAAYVAAFPYATAQEDPIINVTNFTGTAQGKNIFLNGAVTLHAKVAAATTGALQARVRVVVDGTPVYSRDIFATNIVPNGGTVSDWGATVPITAIYPYPGGAGNPAAPVNFKVLVQMSCSNPEAATGIGPAEANLTAMEMY